jgi:hypothetical protein
MQANSVPGMEMSYTDDAFPVTAGSSSSYPTSNHKRTRDALDDTDMSLDAGFLDGDGEDDDNFDEEEDDGGKCLYVAWEIRFPCWQLCIFCLG